MELYGGAKDLVMWYYVQSLLPAVACYENTEDTHAFGDLPGEAPGRAFVFSDAAETGESSQFTVEARQYHTTRPLAPPYSLHTVLLKVE
jgi:hypothetical protein